MENWSPLRLNEKVYITEIDATGNMTSFEVQVFGTDNSNSVLLLFVPETSTVKTVQYHVSRFQEPIQNQSDQYDLTSLTSSLNTGCNLTFQWTVENLHPKIVSIYPSSVDATVRVSKYE